jgi:O-antigen/teichoic acid export membrane protein
MVSTFGSRFGPAGTTLALGAVGLGITLIDGTLATLVLGLGGDRRYARALTATAVLNVALNLAVIPLFGRNGAVIDALVSESLLFALLARTANQLLGGFSMDWDRIARVACAVVPAILAIELLQLGGASVWFQIALGGLTYAAFTVLFGAIQLGEIRHLFLPRFADASRGRSGAA